MSRLLHFLIAFIFISKLSFKAFGFIPFSLPPFIYQWGIHPFISMAINGIIAPLLTLYYFKARGRPLHLTYKIFLLLLWTTIFIETALQIFFVAPEISFFLHLGSFLMVLTLTLLYGQILPSLLPLEKFVQYIRLWSVPITLISLIALIWAGSDLYRGGRFVGLFKHIPHMVSCATVAFIFYLPKVFRPQEKDSTPVIVLRFAILTALFIAIILTGTRSSAIAALFCFVIGLFIFPRNTQEIRFFKVATTISLLTFFLFFGYQIVDYSLDVAKGQKSLGQREAQDGLESRTEEIFRGLELFQESPWTGKGLYYKYKSNDNSLEVGSYNSFKDPHNYFVSAGVIGGWPLIILATSGLILLLTAVWRALQTKNINYQLLGLFMLSHIPIMMIYHLHLSTGGIADRLYWLIFGYLAHRRLT